MTTATNPPSYRGFRFPQAIIVPAGWLYVRFTLSFRDGEALCAARGIVVTYAAVRHWAQKFGQTYANQCRRRRAKPSDTWHLDGVLLTIGGTQHYLWRAVDQEGTVLDILVLSRRNSRKILTFGSQSIPL